MQEQINYVAAQGAAPANGFKNVLVLGALAAMDWPVASSPVLAIKPTRWAYLLKRRRQRTKLHPQAGTTTSPSRPLQRRQGLRSYFDGDAFSDAMRDQAAEVIRQDMGQIDLVVYSLASPVRQHPHTGELHRSSIKPLGEVLDIKTVHVEKGEVSEVSLEPATQEESANTVAVMGGEDWELWMQMLKEQDLLAPGAQTVAYTYIGSELTWPIYWEGTLGLARRILIAPVERSATT